MNRILLAFLVSSVIALVYSSWRRDHLLPIASPLADADRGPDPISWPSSPTVELHSPRTIPSLSASRPGQFLLDLPQPLTPAFQRLAAFANSGDLAELTTVTATDVRALAAFIANTNDRSSLLSFLESALGMPRGLVPEDAEARVSFLAAWFGAIRGDQPGQTVGASGQPNPAPVLPIAFSTTTDSLGRIVASAGSFGAGVNRILAVFESNGWPPELSHVLAVWRSIDTGKVVFQETERIIPSAPSNYIWLNVNEGWPAGNWQLDLFDPQSQFAPLASGTFNIQ